jgi:hypothetical protein
MTAMHERWQAPKEWVAENSRRKIEEQYDDINAPARERASTDSPSRASSSTAI